MKNKAIWLAQLKLKSWQRSDKGRRIVQQQTKTREKLFWNMSAAYFVHGSCMVVRYSWKKVIYNPYVEIEPMHVYDLCALCLITDHQVENTRESDVIIAGKQCEYYSFFNRGKLT